MARTTRAAALEKCFDHPGEALATMVSARNPDGTVFTLPVTNLFAELVGLQRFILSGSGRIALSLAGNLRATVANPAGSGRLVYLPAISAFATATGWASIIRNPTTGLPASAARPHLNAFLVPGAPPGVAVLKADTNASTPLGGGTDSGIVLGVPGGVREKIDLPPFVLYPGEVLGLNIPFAGAADVSLTGYIAEVDL